MQLYQSLAMSWEYSNHARSSRDRSNVLISPPVGLPPPCLRRPWLQLTREGVLARGVRGSIFVVCQVCLRLVSAAGEVVLPRKMGDKRVVFNWEEKGELFLLCIISPASYLFLFSFQHKLSLSFL